MDDTQPVATPAQLGAFMKRTLAEDDPSAALLIDIATGMVRAELRQHLTRVDNDTVVLDPVGSRIILDEVPVLGVAKIETTLDGVTWTTQPSTSYTVSRRSGEIVGLHGYGTRWPTRPGSWRVTYSHGYDPVPSALVGVILGVAARAYVNEVGIEQERTASYQVRYAVEAAGFSPLELRVLRSFTIPRVG